MTQPRPANGLPNGSLRNAPPPSRHPQHYRSVIVPYPVYYGGGFYTGYPSGYTQEAPPSPDYNERGYQQQPAVVIINQGYRPEMAYPQIRDYSNTPLPPPGPQTVDPTDDTPSYYLVAMTDHKIVAAVAYWVDGDTLNYVTLQGDHNRVSLELVDREFSKQLNADRRIAFKLPAK